MLQALPLQISKCQKVYTRVLQFEALVFLIELRMRNASEAIRPVYRTSSHHIFAISLPKTEYRAQVSKPTTPLRQSLFHIKRPLLQATQADFPVQPSPFSFPSM